jgi:hypothetical protein
VSLQPTVWLTRQNRRVDYYLYPWPVEIFNGAPFDWLGPVITFLGSVLLFAGSLIVMWRTNKAGDRRAAAERQYQQERDYRLFQRDTLLRVVDEIVQGFGEIWGRFVEERLHPKQLRQNAIEPIAIER